MWERIFAFFSFLEKIKVLERKKILLGNFSWRRESERAGMAEGRIKNLIFLWFLGVKVFQKFSPKKKSLPQCNWLFFI